MAWLYKQNGSSAWWMGWRAGGRQFRKSTGTSDRKEAEKILGTCQIMHEAHRLGKLTDHFFRSLTGGDVPQVSLKAALKGWLEEVDASTSPKTGIKYRAVADGLESYLGATEAGPFLADVTSENMRQYLTHRRKTISAASVNLERKILSVFFRRAVANEQIRFNPMLAVKPFRPGPDATITRRPFTLDELKLLYSRAPSDFWRYMILAGFYLGQRLGDLICMVWGAVDFPQNLIHLTPRKTANSSGATLHIPIARPLRDFLDELSDKAGAVKPMDFLWPEQAREYLAHGASSFSAEFFNLILAPCGFVVARDDKLAHKRGRAVRRDASPLTFHSLRHSFVTLLKATGGNQAVAKELAGHSSDIVSDLYTKLPVKVLSQAIKKLPKVTK